MQNVVNSMQEDLQESQIEYDFFYGGESFKITPLTYAEWSLIRRSKYDKANIEYVIQNHCHKIIDDKYHTIELNDYHNKPIVIRMIVYEVYLKTSYFHDKQGKDFAALVESTGFHLKTLDGIYDMFIFQHMGWEYVMQSYSDGPQFRALLIALLQHNTGINVKERYDRAFMTGESLDLITPDQHKKTFTDEEIEKMKEEAMRKGVSFENIVSAHEALKDEIHKQKKQPHKKTFNWQADVGMQELAHNKVINNMLPNS